MACPVPVGAKMDDKAATSGEPIPQTNGTCHISERAPADSLPAGKQSTTKNLQPRGQPTGGKQATSRPSTASHTVLKTLNNGTTKRTNVAQSKQPMSRNSSAATTSRVSGKKLVDGSKTSEKTGLDKEVQQKTAKVAAQHTATASKSTIAKPKRTEQTKPSRAWLPGTKNATSSSVLNRAPASDKGFGKPKSTAPPAGQATSVQHQKNAVSTQRDTTRSAMVSKAKPSDSSATMKPLSALKHLKPGSKSQSDPSFGQKVVTAPKTSKLANSKKVPETTKPRTLVKASSGAVHTIPQRASSSAMKIPPVGGSPGKKYSKKGPLANQEQVSTQKKKLQKATAKEINTEVAVVEAESIPIKDTRPLEKIEPIVKAETEEAVLQTCRIEAVETELMEQRDLEKEKLMYHSPMTPAVLECSPDLSKPQDVKASSPKEMPLLTALEELELTGKELNLQTACLPCEQSVPIYMVLSSQTEEDTTFQSLEKQVTPNLDVPSGEDQDIKSLEKHISPNFDVSSREDADFESLEKQVIPNLDVPSGEDQDIKSLEKHVSPNLDVPSREDRDFQFLEKQASPNIDFPNVEDIAFQSLEKRAPPNLDVLMSEQPLILHETEEPDEEMHHLSASPLTEDDQISVEEVISVPSCIERLSSGSFVLEAGLSEQVPDMKLPELMTEIQEELSLQLAESQVVRQAEPSLKIMEGHQADEHEELKVDEGSELISLSLSPEEQQMDAFPIKVEDEVLRSPVDVGTGDVQNELSPVDFRAADIQDVLSPVDFGIGDVQGSPTSPQVKMLHGTTISIEDELKEELVVEVREELDVAHPMNSNIQDHTSLAQSDTALVYTELSGEFPGHDASGSIGVLEDDAVVQELCFDNLSQGEAPECDAPALFSHLPEEMSPNGSSHVSMPKPQTLPLKSLELLQEHPAHLPEVSELPLSNVVLKGHSPERGGSSKSSTLSGPDLAGKSSSETSTPEELRDYDSSSGVESKSDEKLEQTCHQLLSPLEDLPGELDLGIHMEKGDDEAETLPADEVLGDPPTEPTVSSEEEGELDTDLLKDPVFTETVCLSTSPPGKSCLPHSVEESDEPGSGDAGTETPASTNSAASCDVFGAFHLHSTDSCGKSPGLSSLESEEHSTEGMKDQLPKEMNSKTPIDWENPLQVSSTSPKIGGQDEESSQPFTAIHNLAAGNV